MFLGIESREKTYNLIFGDPDSALPKSKTQINGLHDMVSLGADVYRAWSLGNFILEPLEEESNTFELKAGVLLMPKCSTGPSKIDMDADHVSLELTPIEPNEMLIDLENLTPIEDGQIGTFKTIDPDNFSLPTEIH